MSEGQVLGTADPLVPGRTGIHFLVGGIRSACEKGDVWEVEPVVEIAEAQGNHCARAVKLVRRLGWCAEGESASFAKMNGVGFEWEFESTEPRGGLTCGHTHSP